MGSDTRTGSIPVTSIYSYNPAFFLLISKALQGFFYRYMGFSTLDKIKSTDDIKSLSLNELNELAAEVREVIIDSISKNGGHLASSLGVVELTIALLSTYNFPLDKVIWDVGHQSYAYKILTDRKDAFNYIRSYGGISGFPKRKESPYDSFDTGHSSTSISAGLGMCEARDLKHEDFKVVSVIGDGALTGGMAFEALNNLSNLKSNFVIILNDNEMSISKSNGGLSKALLGLRSSTRYGDIKNALKNELEKSSFGLLVKGILIRLINIIKQFIATEGMIFEDLNINYVGPIDGHNIKVLKDVLETAKNSSEPVLIHVKTTKGKGYAPAEKSPTLYHGVSPFDKEKGIIVDDNAPPTYTDVFSKKLISLAKNDANIVAITAAMADGTGLAEFSKIFPDRFFDVEIAEQHAVTFAAGLATRGIIPLVCIYSSFLQRAFDQIIHDVALQNLHVVFMIDRAGLVGADGETHQGIFDISFLKMIPNMTILAPKNDHELQDMMDFAIYKVSGPVAIRYPRGKANLSLHDQREPITYGKAEILFNEKDASVGIFAIGSMVSTAMHIKEKLAKKDIAVSIINARFAKPIDFDSIKEVLKNKKIKTLLVLEENVKSGGIGQDVENYIFDNGYDITVKLFSLPDAYVEHGSVDKLREILHINSDSIIKEVLSSLSF